MRVAVHRLRVHLDVVEPRLRHAFEKILDVTVTALARIGVRLFVEAEKLEIEDLFV